MKRSIFIFGVLLALVSSAAASKNCEKYLEKADNYLAETYNPLINKNDRSNYANMATASLLRYKICLTERPKVGKVEKEDILGDLISDKEREYNKAQWNKVQ